MWLKWELLDWFDNCFVIRVRVLLYFVQGDPGGGRFSGMRFSIDSLRWFGNVVEIVVEENNGK